MQLNEVNLLMSILNIRPQLKSSISPRPWEILHHTSRLFLGIAIQPIVSFVIPTSKSMNEFDQESVYYLLHLCSFTQLRSRISRFAHSSQSLRMDNTQYANFNFKWKITLSVLCTSSTFLFYLLTLISFKIYRHHFISIICSPFSFICTYGVRRVSVSPHHYSIDGNKEAA